MEYNADMRTLATRGPQGRRFKPSPKDKPIQMGSTEDGARLRPEYWPIVRLAVVGKTAVEIAEEKCMSVVDVQNILRRQSVRNAINLCMGDAVKTAREIAKLYAPAVVEQIAVKALAESDIRAMRLLCEIAGVTGNVEELNRAGQDRLSLRDLILVAVRDSTIAGRLPAPVEAFQEAVLKEGTPTGEEQTQPESGVQG
jgi:hypothetical protein